MFAFLSLEKDKSLMVRLPVTSAATRFRGLGFSFSNFLDNRREFASGAVFSNQVAHFNAKNVSKIKVTLDLNYEKPVKVAFGQTKGNVTIKMTVTLTEDTKRQKVNDMKVTVHLIPKRKISTNSILRFDRQKLNISMENFNNPVEIKADFDMTTEVEEMDADIKATFTPTGLVLF